MNEMKKEIIRKKKSVGIDIAIVVNIIFSIVFIFIEAVTQNVVATAIE